jgi:hypothetical protein
MNQQIIYITPSGPSPSPVTVKAGYQILFQMQDRLDEVDVDFGLKSPFVSQVTKFELNGAVTAMASKSYVIDDLSDGHYYFFIMPKTGADPEPPAAPPGDLEVSRDPAPPDDR